MTFITISPQSTSTGFVLQNLLTHLKSKRNMMQLPAYLSQSQPKRKETKESDDDLDESGQEEKRRQEDLL